MELLRQHSWPGNIRELQSVLKRSLLQLRGNVLIPDFLKPELKSASESSSSPPTGDWIRTIDDRMSSGTENLYFEVLNEMERELLTRVLRHTHGNQLQAAKILGITRGSLRTKLRTLGIMIGKAVWSEDDHND